MYLIYTSHLHNLFKFLHEEMLRFMSPQSAEMLVPQKLFSKGLLGLGKLWSFDF